MIRKIKTAKYTNLDNMEVIITFEDGSTAKHIVDDVMREHTSSYLTFLKDGGNVDTFETEEEKALRLEKEAKEEANKQRDELLKKGTVSEDGRMWFNFDSADMFMNAVGTLDNDETIKWYDKDRNIVELTYEEAKTYAKEIRLVMQSLYGLN